MKVQLQKTETFPTAEQELKYNAKYAIQGISYLTNAENKLSWFFNISQK